MTTKICGCSTESSLFMWFSLEVGLYSYGEKEIVVFEHFQFIGLLVGSWGFPSDLSSFIYNMP